MKTLQLFTSTAISKWGGEPKESFNLNFNLHFRIHKILYQMRISTQIKTTTSTSNYKINAQEFLKTY